MKISRCVGDEAMLEESLMVDQDASIEVPVRTIKDLPPPPKLQAEDSESQHRRAFEHSRIIKINAV